MAPFDSSPEFAYFASPQVTQPVTDDVLRVLIEARKLIEKPENWCRGEFARDADGEVAIGKPAVSYCVWGALQRVGATGHGAFSYLEKALPDGRSGYIAFNDDPTTTHADILALFDRAIAARKAGVS